MISQKLRELRKGKGLNQADLAVKLGVTRQTIINWEKGFTQPDGTELKKLLKVFDISFEEMSPEEPEDNLPQADNSAYQIPFYDAVAVGGSHLLAEQSITYHNAQALINPGTFLRSATGSIRIYGHSMFPKYPAGCIVAFKDADKEVIIWGEDYVIELEDRRIIKRLEKGEILDTVKAVSYNKSEEYIYAPIDIPVKKIKRLFMVLGKVELEASI